MRAAEEFRRIKPKKKKTQKANKKQKVSHGDTAAGQAHIDEEEEDDDEPHPPVQEQKRTLGLIILRGETIISISVDAPPPESKRDMPVVCIALITASLFFSFHTCELTTNRWRRAQDEAYQPDEALRWVQCQWFARHLVLRQALVALRQWAPRQVLVDRLLDLHVHHQVFDLPARNSVLKMLRVVRI